MTIAGLIILIGLAYWGLATVPVAGGFLSTAIVAPIHAVAIVTVFSADTRGTESTRVNQIEARETGVDESR